MKHFIYTYFEKDRKHGEVWHCHKTVRIYRIVKGTPVFLATMTETFVDQTQLVMMCMEANKLLPERAFERSPFGGHKHNFSDLRKAGIANINSVF